MQPPPDDHHNSEASHPGTKHRRLWWAAGISAAVLVAAAIALWIPYRHLSKRVDQQLGVNPYRGTFRYYGASEVLSQGDPITLRELTDALKRGGYTFDVSGNSVNVQSNPQVRFQIAGGKLASIKDLNSGRAWPNFQVAPQFITNISENSRTKSTMVRYADLPPVLIQAILSAEDKRFFSHWGFDGVRIAKAVWVDVKDHRKEQGASTISMQLARNLWLDRDKSWKRKAEEALLTMHLEHKLTKQQILEEYCNTVYLGGHGTFGFQGFGEAARALFNKNVQQLNLTEAATLAGLVQRPSYLDPFQFPQRAVSRRNFVLREMRKNEYISPAQYEQALASPIGLHPGAVDDSQSQYFLDAAAQQAAESVRGNQSNGIDSVYTTIDLRLQRAAEQAIADDMPAIDRQEQARDRRLTQRPQVAMIVLDPHTGAVKALCGGRDYSTSQLDRVFSKRPPGSVFKPFVYTAALNSAITGGDTVWTPASTIDDSPTTFQFGNQTYAPSNFKNEFMGRVTLRQALAHSLNVATVKLAQDVGFGNVAAIARRAGLTGEIQPTPALALGAYQQTPFDIARAYTVFANGGVRVEPEFISTIQDPAGGELFVHQPRDRAVLDPRVAYLMVDMLQEVMRSGTAAGVRARGFKLPAAGKTGTSHDGWFAGFTSKLLCIVWVGFDDYRDLNLEGARSALPIWTDFMMRAAQYKQYGNAQPFQPPSGVVQASVDPASGQLSGPNCPGGVSSYFISGTQPKSECPEPQVQLTFTEDGGVVQQRTSAQQFTPNSSGEGAGQSIQPTRAQPMPVQPTPAPPTPAPPAPSQPAPVVPRRTGQPDAPDNGRL